MQLYCCLKKGKIKIREVRAITIGDDMSGDFAAYKIIYASKHFCAREFDEITPEIEKFINGKTPKYEKNNVQYSHYVAIWTA